MKPIKRSTDLERSDCLGAALPSRSVKGRLEELGQTLRSPAWRPAGGSAAAASYRAYRGCQVPADSRRGTAPESVGVTSLASTVFALILSQMKLAARSSDLDQLLLTLSSLASELSRAVFSKPFAMFRMDSSKSVSAPASLLMDASGWTGMSGSGCSSFADSTNMHCLPTRNNSDRFVQAC